MKTGEEIRIEHISIHAPPRGATNFFERRKSMENFNSRPSARGDNNPACWLANGKKFQFTPLREGRRCKV